MLRAVKIAVFVLTLPFACSADDLIGQATVIDGDTIEIHGQRIRLFGIDAPESGQTCKDAESKAFRCGQVAALILDAHIRERTVACRDTGGRNHERIVAVCSVDGDDLGRWMVRHGQAVASRKYSLDYVADEDDARTAGRGIWRGTFVMPWDWLKGVR